MSSVLITGGTGSFGNAFVRYLLAQRRDVRRIIVFSRDEKKQADMSDALAPLDAEGRVRFFLGDVRERARLEQAFCGVDVVIHAAALKRVDALSYNPGEAKRTNIDGTENVCTAAIAAMVQRVIVISSDKAVMPTNLYGCSKQFGEYLAVQANSYGAPQGTRLAVVRYGNVLGSRGSVVERWAAQLSRGEPLTLTDERMTRFWLTLEQCCELVQVALDRMRGGEVFVPRLPSLLVTDLAQALALATARTHMGFRVTGLRPGGEKLHECLMAPQEAARARAWDGIYLVPPEIHPWTSKLWDVGDPLPAGYQYSSECNDRWLTVAEVAELVRPFTGAV